jgi:hypothetical protein
VKRKLLVVSIIAVLSTGVVSAYKRPAVRRAPSAPIAMGALVTTTVVGSSDAGRGQAGSLVEISVLRKLVTTMFVSALPNVLREENTLLLVGFAFFSIGFLGLRRAQRAATSESRI